MLKVSFYLLHLICGASVLQVQSSMIVVRQWNELKFEFPDIETKRLAIRRKYYIPDPLHNVPLDVDVYYSSNSSIRTFITIPRFDSGRPITLGTLDDQGRVHAYPNYAWHDIQGENCNGLTSVFRTAIDKCERLWVLDAGRIGQNFNCRPQLLAFNLNTDELVFRHQFSDSSYTPDSLYVTPVVDVRNNDCSDTFVYMADTSSFALGVVDVAKNISWRMVHPYFYPYPDAGNFIIDGSRFDLMDGIFALALSPARVKDRKLYFHALASVTENVVLTSVLRDSSYVDDSTVDFDLMQILPGLRVNQSGAEAMDSNGILYFGIMNPPSIWCWNSNTEYLPENLHPIHINEEIYQFASGVKVIVNNRGEEELWVLTSSFQRFMDESMSADKINFRVITGLLSKILYSSPCAWSKQVKRHCGYGFS